MSVPYTTLQFKHLICIELADSVLPVITTTVARITDEFSVAVSALKNIIKIRPPYIETFF